MKIVFLSDDFPPTSFGGAGISTYELALGVKKAGHEVFVITTCRKREKQGDFDYSGLTVFRIANEYHEKWRAYVSLNNFPITREVEKLIRKIKPDVVHINNVHGYLSYKCFKISKKYAKAVIFTARDVMTFNYGKLATKQYLENFNGHTSPLDHLRQAKRRYNPLRNLFIKRYLKYADQIFSVSQALEQALIQNGIKNVQVIHTGVDIASYSVTYDEKVQFREKYNLATAKIIFFGGRLSEAKGGRKLLEALLHISKEIPEAVLLVVGSLDAYAEKMKEEASKLGIKDKLVFTGWVDRDEIKYAVASSDVVIVPSIIFDSFPRVVIEAMASERPVVGTCYGGASEIIVDGVTGYIVNPLYPEEIAIKTIDLLKDSEKAEQFGRAGYERIKKDFNLEDKVNEYIVVYESLCNK